MINKMIGIWNFRFIEELGGEIPEPQNVTDLEIPTA